MDNEQLPLKNRLSYRFLLSTAVFILLIEVVLRVLSVAGFQSRLYELRELLTRRTMKMEEISPETMLPQYMVWNMTWEYIRNILLMAVVTGLYFATGCYNRFSTSWK